MCVSKTVANHFVPTLNKNFSTLASLMMPDKLDNEQKA